MSFWFRRNPKPRKRPDWAAPGIWKKMTGYFSVRLFGREYHFPITPETEPFVLLMEGRDPWPKGVRENKRVRLAEMGMLDILSALLGQVRDGEVAEAASMLGQDLRDALTPLVQGKLTKMVDIARIERKLDALPP